MITDWLLPTVDIPAQYYVVRTIDRIENTPADRDRLTGPTEVKEDVMAQSRSESTPARPRRAVWTVIGILLVAVLAGTLWVPFYNRTTPTLGG